MDNPALGSGKLAAYYGYMRANNAVVLALFFLLGVGLFEARASWLVMITAGLAAAALFWRRRATWRRVAIISMAIFAGAFYCAFRLNWSRGDLVLGEEVKVAGTVLEAEPSGSLLRITASTEGSGEQIEMATFSALAPEYGDIVEATGVLKSAGGGRISFTSPVDAKIVGHAGVNPVARELFRLRDALSAKIKRALPADKSALALGILLGDKSDFTKEFSRRINKSGLAHIAALSGYNVAILSVYFSGAVGFLILHRGWRLIVTSAAILLFIIMTGASASLVRAGIMGIVGLILKSGGRITDTKFPIIWTAFFMVVADPKVLLFDRGFELSFAALLGLVYLEPVLKKRVGKILRAGESAWTGWKEVAVQTVSAELAVAPLVAIFFRQFSPWAVLSNIAVLPTIPLAMFLTFLTALAGFASSSLSLIFSWPLSILIGYEELVINIFGGAIL